VVCIETNSAATDPFCGFTELTGKGEAPRTTEREISGFSDPMVAERAGEKLWYSFNFAQGTREGDKDELTCFDLTTGAACAGQPYAVTLPAGTIETTNNEPDGETAVIGGETIIPMNVSGEAWMACFNTSSQESCSGQWPVKVGGNYQYGAPFPMLSATGSTIGLCVPASGDPCYNLEGEPVSTPANMPSVIGDPRRLSGWRSRRLLRLLDRRKLHELPEGLARDRPALYREPRPAAPDLHLGELRRRRRYAAGADRQLRRRHRRSLR
jgi:hypothetical protein